MSTEVPVFAYVRASCCTLDAPISLIVKDMGDGSFLTKILGSNRQVMAKAKDILPIADGAELDPRSRYIAIPMMYGGMWFLFQKAKDDNWTIVCQCFNKDTALLVLRALRATEQRDSELVRPPVGQGLRQEMEVPKRKR